MYNLKKYILLLLLCLNTTTHVTEVISQTLSTALGGRSVVGLHMSVNDLGHAMAVWGLQDTGPVYTIEAAYFDGTSWSSATTISDGDGGLSPWVSLNNSDKAVAVWQTDLASGKIKSNTFIGGSWQGAETIQDPAIFEYPNATVTDFPTSRTRVGIDETGNAVVSWLETDTSIDPTNFYVYAIRSLDLSGNSMGNANNWSGLTLLNTGLTDQRIFMDPTSQIFLLFSNGGPNGAIALISWIRSNDSGYVSRYSSTGSVIPSNIQYGITNTGNGSSNCIDINRAGDVFGSLIMDGGVLVRDLRKATDNSITECTNTLLVNELYQIWTTISGASNPVLHQAVSFLQHGANPFNQFGYRIVVQSPTVLDCSTPLPSTVLDIDFSSTMARMNPMICSFDDNTALLMWNSQGEFDGNIGIMQYDGTHWDKNSIQYIDADLIFTNTIPALDVPFYLSCTKTMSYGQHYAGLIWWDNTTGEVKSLLSNGTYAPFVPSPVTNINAVCDANTSSITISWDISPDIDIANQYVYRDNGDGVFSDVSGALSTSTNSFVDNTVSLGINYTYFIRVENNAGLLSNSNGISLTCAQNKPLPPIAVNAQCISGSSSISTSITWALDPNNTNTIQKFQLYRELLGSSPQLIADNIAPTTFSYQDTTAIAGSVYTYRVYTISNNVQSDPSQGALVGPCTISGPPAPTAFQASTQSLTSVLLNWNPVPTSADVDAYILFRDGYPLIELSSTTTFYLDPTAMAGEEYVYAIKSVRFNTPRQLSDAASTFVSQVSGKPEAPKAVASLCADDGSKAINVVWYTSDTADIDSYNIYRHASDGVSQIASGISNKTFIYKDTQINFNEFYDYHVSAVKDSVESEIIVSNIIICYENAPAMISDLSAECDGTTRIILNWTPVSNNCKRQIVYRNGNPVAVFTGCSDRTHDDYFSISLNTPYTYFVQSIDNNNNLITSNHITIVCYSSMPDAPEDDEQSCILENNNPAVRISWQPPAGIVSQNIYRNNVLINTVGPSITEFIDTSIAHDITYSYNISGVAAGGEETKSRTISFSCSAPVKAENIEGFCTFNRFALEGEYFKTINWTIPSDKVADVKSQKIHRDNVLIATLGANERQFIDHDRPTGVNETYTITTVNAIGDENNAATLTLSC